jgi:predicted flap endonuclease-1-like 5' DNA nuclease
MIGGGLLMLVLSLGGAAAAFFALWQRKGSRQKVRSRAGRPAAASAADSTVTPRRQDRSDDLKVIEGIGPRTEEVLNEAGITTFAQLAKLQPDRLESIMRDAGTLVARRDTWPEQAHLAAAGDWQGLSDLKDRLKGATTD